MENEFGSELKKHIEEGWKEKEQGNEGVVKDEKDSKSYNNKSEEVKPHADFGQFILGLGMQILISLGDAPNPITNKKEKNLDQASYMIDILDILKEKTKRNLTKEEDALLESTLYELRMRYITLTRSST